MLRQAAIKMHVVRYKVRLNQWYSFNKRDVVSVDTIRKYFCMMSIGLPIPFGSIAIVQSKTEKNITIEF